MKRAILVAGFCLCAATASAQVPIEGEIIALEGIRLGVRDGAGKIYQIDVTQTWRTPDGRTWQSQTPVSVIVSGTEDPKALRPGQSLQFTATMAGKRTVVGEVKTATLITLTPQSQTGILNSDPAAAPEQEDDKKKAAELEECLVVGTITKIKYGVVTVAAPNLKPLTFRFADDATLTVSGNDLSMVRVGDKIKAMCTAVVPPLMVSQEVKIEHSPAVDQRAPRPKPEDVAAKKGQKPGEREDPFALGDPTAGKPKVKLELIKTN